MVELSGFHCALGEDWNGRCTLILNPWLRLGIFFLHLAITQPEQPNHVILSAETYQQLLSRLQKLEDLNLGKVATQALAASSMVGADKFTATLEVLIR